MSASKTVYPGMPTSGNGGIQGNNPQHPMTQFPGMSQMPETEKGRGKPIMGFLFSVSKTAYGEYWPLYVGPNTIGRGSNCSICLKEASVSDNHATLVIRKMQNKGENNGVFVFIQDTGSMCGTMLNGVTLDFNPKECKNGDIITIGTNYELYFILVDPDSLGLAPKEDFQVSGTKVETGPGWVPQPPIGMNAGDAPKGTQPGTGSTPFDGRKPTIYMPNSKK